VAGKDPSILVRPAVPLRDAGELVEARRHSWLDRVSDNVGRVKLFRAHCGVHSEKSAISLSLKICALQPSGSWLWRSDGAGKLNSKTKQPL